MLFDGAACSRHTISMPGSRYPCSISIGIQRTPHAICSCKANALYMHDITPTSEPKVLNPAQNPKPINPKPKALNSPNPKPRKTDSDTEISTGALDTRPYMVNPGKLEHGCRRISARIPYTLP